MFYAATVWRRLGCGRDVGAQEENKRRCRRGVCVGSTSTGTTRIGQQRSMAFRSISDASWVSTRGSVTLSVQRRQLKPEEAAAVAVREEAVAL